MTTRFAGCPAASVAEQRSPWASWHGLVLGTSDERLDCPLRGSKRERALRIFPWNGGSCVQEQPTVQFVDIEEGLTFPLPSSAELAAYVVYVGFDEVGDKKEKKPGKDREKAGGAPAVKASVIKPYETTGATPSIAFMGPRHVRAPSAILAGLRRSLPRARATQNASLRPYRIDRQGVEPSDLRSAIVRPRSRSVCAAFELPDRIAFGVATGSAPTAILDSAGDLPQNARNLAPRIALERRIIRAHRQLEHWHYPGAIRSHILINCTVYVLGD